MHGMEGYTYDNGDIPSHPLMRSFRSDLESLGDPCTKHSGHGGSTSDAVESLGGADEELVPGGRNWRILNFGAA